MNNDRKGSSEQEADDTAAESEDLAGETSGGIEGDTVTPGLQSKDEQIAFLEAEIEGKEDDLKGLQEKYKQLKEEQLDREKAFEKANKEVGTLQNKVDDLHKKWMKEQMARIEAEKKLTTAEQELQAVKSTLADREAQLKADRKESTKRLNGMVEVLGDLDSAEIMKTKSLIRLKTPRLHRHYYGSSNFPVSPNFNSSSAIPLHLEIDCRGMDAAKFPIVCEGKIFARNLATADKFETLEIKRTIPNPSLQDWDYKMTGLGKGNYRMQGYLSYSIDGKPSYDPTTFDLGVVTIYL